MPEILRVATQSDVSSVAGAISGTVRDHGKAEIQVIGAGALNQAIKAVAVARGFLIPTGIEIALVPTFTNLVVHGEDRTAIRLSIFKTNVEFDVGNEDDEAYEDAL